MERRYDPNMTKDIDAASDTCCCVAVTSTISAIAVTLERLRYMKGGCMPYSVFTVVQAWQELQSHIECQSTRANGSHYLQSCATDINMLCAAAEMQQSSSHSINVGMMA